VAYSSTSVTWLATWPSADSCRSRPS